MNAQEKMLAKNRGRPATGRGETIGVRLHPPNIAAIDKWREKQTDMPTRPEAIRRLVELGLRGPTLPPKKKGLTGMMVKR
jgi:hypothetical protein